MLCSTCLLGFDRCEIYVGFRGRWSFFWDTWIPFSLILIQTAFKSSFDFALMIFLLSNCIISTVPVPNKQNISFRHLSMVFVRWLSQSCLLFDVEMIVSEISAGVRYKQASSGETESRWWFLQRFLSLHFAQRKKDKGKECALAHTKSIHCKSMCVVSHRSFESLVKQDRSHDQLVSNISFCAFLFSFKSFNSWNFVGVFMLGRRFFTSWFDSRNNNKVVDFDIQSISTEK